MDKPRYRVVVKAGRLAVFDLDGWTYLNREDYIGAETHDSLIREYRRAHPEHRKTGVYRRTT